RRTRRRFLKRYSERCLRRYSRRYFPSFARTRDTSRDVTGAAALPHVLRINVSTRAISLSVSLSVKDGILRGSGPLSVCGLSPPSTSKRTSDVLDAPSTAGLPASRGYFCGTPAPSI